MALSIKPIEIVTQGKHQLLTKAKHWERVELSYVAVVQNGFAFKSNLFTHSDGMPLIRIRDIDRGKTENFYSGNYSEDFVVRKGNILIGMDGDFNASIWQGSDGLLNQRVCRLIPITEKFSAKFLSLCLQPYLNAINAETSSVTVKHLSSKTIGEIPLPLPPTNEQHRIVAKIEALFSELDKGMESFKTAREQLKIYRQAVLKHAFSGKLTEQWRAENQDAAQGCANAAGGQEPGAAKLETAEALLQRIQTEREQRYQQQLNDWEVNGKQGNKPKAPKTLPPLTAEELAELPELPEGWAWVKVGETSDVQLGRQRSPNNRSNKFPTKYIRAGNITENGLNLDDVLDMEFDPQEKERFLLVYGDVLLSEASGSANQVGKPAIWRDEIEECCFQNTVIRVRSIALNEYLFWVFKTYYVTGVFSKLSGGVGINHLSAGKLENMAIPIVGKFESEKILELINEKLSLIENVDQTLTIALQQAEALRQSILKKAFSGQLVPQDPNDETASVLLERIKNSRQDAEAQRI
ncbi:restriction endonuclease subunit S [Methyloglobulus sp.]|uniref:restriction endonuclease subunit S n=1 Tax=Methyloglobulus sp. TaxID=2518622 RepID=UPI003988E6B0